MLESFTVQTFEGLVGDTFRVRTPAGTSLETTLIEAEARPAPRRPQQRVPFSLVFRSDPDLFVPQGTYLMEHDRLGEFDLFIVPIGPDGDGMRYEAIFT